MNVRVGEFRNDTDRRLFIGAAVAMGASERLAMRRQEPDDEQA